MSPHRCQVCGRRKWLKADGTIVAHFTRGDRCLGAGYPPLAESDERLVWAIDHAEQQAAHFLGIIRDHRERRLNEPLPLGVWVSAAHWTKQEMTLGRRLKRHRDAPARRARQLAKYGYTWE